jgi:uncharacterized protein
VTASVNSSAAPDYGQLVKFLFQPFLSVVEELSVDCEYTIDRHRVWIRVAVANTDQGSAFGRGGRNIQAIRTVVQAAATTVGQKIVLDVYGNNSGSRLETADRYEERAASSDRSSTGERPVRSAPNRRTQNGGENPNGAERDSVPKPRPRKAIDS